MELEDRETNISLVHKNSRKFDIDPHLLMAIIDTENKHWSVWLNRYEDGYLAPVIPNHFAEKNNITMKTEQILQKTSWGLTQITGALCRFLGYQGPIPALIVPDLNLFWTARYLAKLDMDFGSLNDVISAYRLGNPVKKTDGSYRNQDYVDSVLEAYIKYRK